MALVVVIVRMFEIRSEVIKVGKPISQLLFFWKSALGRQSWCFFSCLFSFLCQSFHPVRWASVSIPHHTAAESTATKDMVDMGLFYTFSISNATISLKLPPKNFPAVHSLFCNMIFSVQSEKSKISTPAYLHFFHDIFHRSPRPHKVTKCKVSLLPRIIVLFPSGSTCIVLWSNFLPEFSVLFS